MRKDERRATPFCMSRESSAAGSIQLRCFCIHKQAQLEKQFKARLQALEAKIQISRRIDYT